VCFSSRRHTPVCSDAAKLAARPRHTTTSSFISIFMAPTLVTVDPSLTSEDERRAARGEQKVLLDTAAGGPALKATCMGWLATEEIEGKVAVAQCDWRRLALHGATFAAECDDVVYFSKEPGMACTARLWEGMQAKGLAFEGELPFPKLLQRIEAAAKLMDPGMRTVRASDLVDVEAMRISLGRDRQGCGLR
jgi:hypothetical protein